MERLALDMGFSGGYLRGMLKNAEQIPRVDVVHSMARQLSCTVDTLLKVGAVPSFDVNEMAGAISKQLSKAVQSRLSFNDERPTGKDIMCWYDDNGGRLEAYDSFDGMFDLYHCPTGDYRKIVPHTLGSNSLSTKTMGSNSFDLFQKTIAPLGENFAGHILKAHQSSINSGPITTMETLDVEHPTDKNRIRIKYLRTLAPVILPEGGVCVLNYSELVRRP